MDLRVLIVEDEPLIGMHLADFVEGLGFEVRGPMMCSQSALTAATDLPPNIAIVDVNLADGPTGPYVASQLAKKFGTQVLMVTANPELVVEGVGGVVLVLTKPCDESKVAKALAMIAARLKGAASTARD